MGEFIVSEGSREKKRGGRKKEERIENETGK
jgi:hypothetical protein